MLRLRCSLAKALTAIDRNHHSPVLIRQVSSLSLTSDKRAELLQSWAQYQLVDPCAEKDASNTYIGFLGKKRNLSKLLSFAELTTPSGQVIQLCSNGQVNQDAHTAFRQIHAFSPVTINTRTPSIQEQADDCSHKTTVYVGDIRALNNPAPKLIVTPETVFPPKKRHLQIRFHPEIQARLEFRSWLKNALHQGFMEKGFTEIETPTLFKSTPEGAREFLVPTRKRGTAYALAQSPQQYKQILMASGITRYLQWARCYRDEDSRADRQPEFSQLDMEWAFAGAATVRKDINDVILRTLSFLQPSCYEELRGNRIPVIRKIPAIPVSNTEKAYKFTTLTCAEAIAAYGSDKPDLRIPGRIYALQDLESYKIFVGTITHLENPTVEAFTFRLKNVTPEDCRKLVTSFMDNLPSEFGENPEGKPQILIYDTGKPLCGFASIGFEYEALLQQITQGDELQNGDLVVFQARDTPRGQYSFGSTKLGDLRIALWKKLVEQGYMSVPRNGEAGSLQFVWVTEFPMFKPTEEGEPDVQGGAGLAASHHPFTAPLSQADLELLMTKPLEAKSAAYDLVLNGVEIGGGSVRNHIADVQEFIMRDVLQMEAKRMADFSHLFEVLRSHCPPHAGFALGFDRMVALMTDTSTVRDVLAFPKTMKGEDNFVMSPSKITDEQLEPYGLQLRRRNQ